MPGLVETAEHKEPYEYANGIADPAVPFPEKVVCSVGRSQRYQGPEDSNRAHLAKGPSTSCRSS
jgi:hypothetical protein